MPLFSDLYSQKLLERPPERAGKEKSPDALQIERNWIVQEVINLCAVCAVKNAKPKGSVYFHSERSYPFDEVFIDLLQVSSGTVRERFMIHKSLSFSES